MTLSPTSLQLPPDKPHHHFPQLAYQLLHQTQLSLQHTPYRILEIEFYLHQPQHPDPFPHQHPLQLSCGNWYLHHHKHSLRTGTFKGLDLTFGPPNTYGGILLRSIQSPQGTTIEGPSNLVQHILHQTQLSLPQLHQQLQTQNAWQNPLLQLQPLTNPQHSPIYHSPRIGLQYPCRQPTPQHWHFLFQPYRFFLHPHRLKKGRHYTILALIAQKYPLPRIHQLTHSPIKTIQNYIQLFQIGKNSQHLPPQPTKSPHQIAKLYGKWCQQFPHSITWNT